MSTMFVDASALTSIIVGEDDADVLAACLGNAVLRLTSAIALWETTVAVARIKGVSLDLAGDEVRRFTNSLTIAVESIGLPEMDAALAAHARYGKGNDHPARLNMGDCFAYACAQINRAQLLYKGNDFSHTDLG